MPTLDITTLNGPQLRQLLDSARARGQATLAYQILQEMAARREGGGGVSVRAADDARVVAVDLGDPLEPADVEAEPLHAEPFEAPGPEAEPALTLDPVPDPNRRPARRRKGEPREARVARGRGAREPSPRRRGRGVTAGFAIGIGAGAVAGVVLGWGLGELTHEALGPAPSMPAPIQTAALAPPPAALPPPVASTPAADSVPLNALPPEAADAPIPTDVRGEQAEPETAPEPTPEPEPQPQPLTVKAAAVKPAAGKTGCDAEQTLADRTICGDPDLQRLQRELRDAYADALAAHEDRALLRQHQLEWREARNAIGEPDRLARLYEQRIRKLNAAAAAAREGRE